METNNMSIYEVSHELKNPLTIINGYLDLIKKSNSEDISNYLSIIKKETDRSISIINDILYSYKLKNNSFYIKDLFKDIKDIAYSFINDKNKKLIFKVEDNIKVNSDYNKLKEVLINLIKNSIESISKKGFVLIYSYIMNDELFFIIKDNGIGMNKYVLSSLKKNIRLTTKENGNGIGINYSRKIITSMKGKIKFTSKINKGTVTTITIPL